MHIKTMFSSELERFLECPTPDLVSGVKGQLVQTPIRDIWGKFSTTLDIIVKYWYTIQEKPIPEYRLGTDFLTNI